MSQKERNEWIERAKQRVLNNAEITDQSVKEIMFLFDEAAWTLETEINSMFQKYATENGLTNAEASKLLTGSEYSRWKKGIEEYLKEAEGDSKTLLELNTLAMKSRISRKEQMLATVYQTMITLSRDTETKITDLLGDMFKTNYYRGCYDVQSILGVGFNVSKVDVKMLQRILKHPWSGKNYSQALWENTDKLATLAKRELTMGFMNGSSVQKMAKEINDVMGKGRYAAERLVRTESSWVLFSILVFGGLLGFVGMIIGVPAFAVIYDLVKKCANYLLRQKKLTTDTDTYQELVSIEQDGGQLRYVQNADRPERKKEEQEETP